MAYRRVPFAQGEWYHCYSRGVDKRITFEDKADYERFIQLLYLANDTVPIDRNLLPLWRHEQILVRDRTVPMVAIGGYCLMPNHFHILLKEITENGITEFMRKVGTGYVMYFNAKKQRVGNLFVKPFRSKHVGDDRYLRHVLQYIHLNAAELFEPEWKKGGVKDMQRLRNDMENYVYSSLPEYLGKKRTETNLLDKREFNFLNSGVPPLSEALIGAREYYSRLDSRPYLGGVTS